MESKTSRYQSRALREMNRVQTNPFGSPPSSTGSHGTVTLTSDISFGGNESMHLPDLAGRHTKNQQATPYRINTSAIGRNFPEWKGWNNTREVTDDMYGTTSDHITEAQAAKENIPPSSSTAASPTNEVRMHKAFHNDSGPPLRARSRMQARVDAESDGEAHTPLRQAKASPNIPKTGRNVSILIETMKAAQAKEIHEKTSSPRVNSGERPSSPRQRPDIASILGGTPNQTARSFFLPNLTHINDFVAGDLRLFTKNGIPIFVKGGKVHDRGTTSAAEQHTGIDAIELPEDEKKIFISLDNIREEIRTLREHDDQVTRQAEDLQEEVFQLRVQLSSTKSRKDSAMGSDSETSIVDRLSNQKAALEDQVLSLQSQLEKANRKISINEIHAESYVNERDEAWKSVDEQLEKIGSLQEELDAVREDLAAAQNVEYPQDTKDLEAELLSLRKDNNGLRQQQKSMLDENQSLRAHNATLTQQNTELQREVRRLDRLLASSQDDYGHLQEQYEVIVQEKRTVRQDNLSLERHNDNLYTEQKSLEQKKTLLERQLKDLKENNARLHEMLDVANEGTGMAALDVKDIKDRLGKQNRQLSDENARLSQQIIDLKAEISLKQTREQDSEQLVAKNERLHEQIALISQQFEQIIREGRERTTQFVERQSGLTQQFGGPQPQEKPSKVTRIVEPTTSMKGKTTTTDLSARSMATPEDMQDQDDLTQQIDLTEGSDFGDIFPKEGTERLRETLRRARFDSTQQSRQETLEIEDDGVTEDMSLPPFPSLAHQTDSASNQAESRHSRLQSGLPKRPPPGILKNAQDAQRGVEQDVTGRFSVKSAISGMSLPSQTGRTAESTGRRHSDSARVEVAVEENMTSAFFMDDITLESRKRAAEQHKAARSVTALSNEAKQVLDSLCHDHDGRNCFVCARLHTRQHEEATGDHALTRKKTVRVERPVPVTDRVPNPTTTAHPAHEEQPTTRPFRDPAVSLAIVMKGLEDEAAHIKTKLAEKHAQLNRFDASFGRSQLQQLRLDLNKLMRMLNLKHDQIYALHDVLEGQKMAGQQMSAAEIDVTVASIMSKDVTWDGIMD